MLLAMVFDWFLFRSCMKTVATPKQIRELMKVDGLTNDEVKSHLQVYINYFILSLSLSLSLSLCIYIPSTVINYIRFFLSVYIHTFIQRQIYYVRLIQASGSMHERGFVQFLLT
jgi:hypothetical protein